MNLVLYKVIAAILIFVISIATTLYPLKRKTTPFAHTESLEIGEALASGIFLGAAFFHMLPDAISIYARVYPNTYFPVPEAICVSGFLFFLFLERFSLANLSLPTQISIPYILTITLIIHALIEGIALGIGPTFSEAFMIFVAILAHKGTESFALCIAMLQYQWPFKQVVLTIILFSLMTPLGIGIGTVINSWSVAGHGELEAASFSAFVAGTFLYISTLHHVHFHKHATPETQAMVEFSFLLLGVVIMAAIAVWA